MTYQPHQSEDVVTKPVSTKTEPELFTEAELLAGDVYNARQKELDPFRQAEADRLLGRDWRGA